MSKLLIFQSDTKDDAVHLNEGLVIEANWRTVFGRGIERAHAVGVLLYKEHCSPLVVSMIAHSEALFVGGSNGRNLLFFLLVSLAVSFAAPGQPVNYVAYVVDWTV